MIFRSYVSLPECITTDWGRPEFVPSDQKCGRLRVAYGGREFMTSFRPDGELQGVHIEIIHHLRMKKGIRLENPTEDPAI